jgi:hypothetical protein
MSTEIDDAARNLSRDEMMSALFAHLVFQNTNMALMMMGRVPNPSTNDKLFDLDAARMFIDQLEMIEAKTKGNLNKEESRILQQSLTHLRLAFVEAVENGSKAAEQPSAAPAQPSGAAQTPEAPAQPAQEAKPDAAAEDESRKRFTKKY